MYYAKIDREVIASVPRGTSKATWKASHRLMRMSHSEQFHHPLTESLQNVSAAAFTLRYVIGDRLAYLEKFGQHSLTIHHMARRVK